MLLNFSNRKDAAVRVDSRDEDGVDAVRAKRGVEVGALKALVALLGFDDNGLEVAVQIFSIRGGRIRGATFALLLPAAEAESDLPLHRWVEERLLPLAGEPEEVQRLAQRTVAEYGRIDVWINNAGVVGPLGPLEGPV